jgi:hypothetical protein
MPTTYVYATTAVDVPVGLSSMSKDGPADISATLERNSLPAHSGGSLRIASIPRWIDDLSTLDVPFTLQRASGGVYLASLQVLLRGHGTGSGIWWRWRTTSAWNGTWTTDHDPHAVVVCDSGRRYAFTVRGVKTTGYDDVLVSLAET